MMNKYITTYGANGYFDLAHLTVGANTVFKAKFMPLDSPNGFLFGNFSSTPYLAIFHPDSRNVWPSNTFRWYIKGSEGLAYEAASVSDIIGHEFEIELSSGTVKINGNTASTTSFSNYTYPNFGIGYGFSPTFDFQKPIRWEYFQVWNGQDLVYDYIPAFNDGKYCFYDRVRDTYLYATGNVDGVVTSIVATPQKSTLAADGETINISVNCPNAWTVTGNTFITLSSTGDTGSTTITATAPSYSGATARTDTLTFTDSVTGDEVEITLKQKKVTVGQPLYLGLDEISELYLGAHQISEAYLGEHLVYSSGPFVGLKVNPSTLEFNTYKLEVTLNVKSSEAWTITTPSWISASTATGDSGKTVITLTASAQTADTSGTIEVVSANYSATVACDYSTATYNELDCIYEDGSSSFVISHNIDTGIAHTSPTMKAQITYYGRGGNSDRMIGYAQDDDGCSSDNNDFRVFGYNNGTYDYMNARYTINNAASRDLHSYTISDNWCKDDILDQVLVNGTAFAAVPSPGCHIYVDVSLIKVKAAKITDGNTVLFDGVAAEDNGVYGLFDRVSNRMVTNSNIVITGDQLTS